jgi:hypothetical protein
MPRSAGRLRPPRLRSAALPRPPPGLRPGPARPAALSRAALPAGASARARSPRAARAAATSHGTSMDAGRSAVPRRRTRGVARSQVEGRGRRESRGRIDPCGRRVVHHRESAACAGSGHSDGPQSRPAARLSAPSGETIGRTGAVEPSRREMEAADHRSTRGCKRHATKPPRQRKTRTVGDASSAGRPQRLSDRRCDRLVYGTPSGLDELEGQSEGRSGLSARASACSRVISAPKARV